MKVSELLGHGYIGY